MSSYDDGGHILPVCAEPLVHPLQLPPHHLAPHHVPPHQFPPEQHIGAGPRLRPPGAQRPLVVVAGQLLQGDDRDVHAVGEEHVPEDRVVGRGELGEVAPGLGKPEAGHEDALYGHREHLQHLHQAVADYAPGLLAHLHVQQRAVDQGESELDVAGQDGLLGRGHVLAEVVEAALVVAAQVVVEPQVDGHHEGGQDDGAAAGGEDGLQVQVLVHLVAERLLVQAQAHVREVVGEVGVEEHEQDVEEHKGEDGDPDGKTEVADDEVVPLADEADVLGVLNKEGAEEEAAHEDVEGDDTEELGHDDQAGAQVVAEEEAVSLKVAEARHLEGEEQEVDATEGKVDGEEGARQVVEGGPEGGSQEDVDHRGAVDGQAEDAEEEADGGGDELDGVLHGGRGGEDWRVVLRRQGSPGR